MTTLATQSSSHTPGPWELTKEHLSIQAYPPGDIVKICSNPSGMNYLDRNNWLANAPLIAAAPDLLEACLLVRNVIRDCSPAFLEKIDAAIAKATGEKS